MIRNRVLYILTTLACFGFSMAYTGKISQILLFIMLLYPVAAFVPAVIQLLLVGADFRANRVTMQKELSFDLIISVYNRFIFPAVPIELICRLPDGDTGLFSNKQLFISLPPFGKTDIAIRCRHKFRGSYNGELRRICVVDPLRIIRVSKKLDRSVQMIFLPRKLNMDDLIFRSAVEQSFAQKQLRSTDKEDFSHVREYRDGDILQMVHWKLTAKQDELMIKQFDSITDLRAAILCDYGQSNDIMGMTCADMIIETALAFAKTALEKGMSSSVDIGALNALNDLNAFNSGISLITDAGSFNSFFELMSVIPPDLNTADFCSMIDELDKSSAAILVLITPRITEELIDRTRNAAQQVTVFYAYLNLDSRPLEYDFSDERFLFLNILGTDENALENAAAKITENAGERL